MADETGQNDNVLMPAANQAGAGDDGGDQGAPAWMATFADLVTLLMCFFVLLFAMSTTQQETFKELVKSMKSALGVQQIPEAGTREGLTMHEVPPEPSESDEAEAVDELGAMVQKEIDEILSDVRELIMFNRLGGMVKVQESDIGPVITISDVLVFQKGEADMSKEGLYILKQVAEILKQFAYHIKVAGHTDSTPIYSSRYESNWELSSSRASKIVRFLEDQGIDPKNLSAIGYAHYKPIATNDTEDGRAQNRRVEIYYERNDMINSIIDKKDPGKQKKKASPKKPNKSLPETTN